MQTDCSDSRASVLQGTNRGRRLATKASSDMAVKAILQHIMLNGAATDLLKRQGKLEQQVRQAQHRLEKRKDMSNINEWSADNFAWLNDCEPQEI